MRFFTKHFLKFVTVVLLLFGCNMLRAQTIANEKQIKAVFLFNFSQFVEWPASAFSEPQTPLTIGILGDNPFGKHLEQVVHNEKINNRSISIQHYTSVEEIKTCHILFINISDKAQLAEILKKLQGKCILTVGDSRNFIKEGGMVRFITENDKIKFQINTDVAKAADLTISSKLLRLAEIVTNKNN